MDIGMTEKPALLGNVIKFVTRAQMSKEMKQGPPRQLTVLGGAFL
jgi:hypothetical protein